jgi:hypothetical protein
MHQDRGVRMRKIRVATVREIQEEDSGDAAVTRRIPDSRAKPDPVCPGEYLAGSSLSWVSRRLGHCGFGIVSLTPTTP